MQPFEIFRTGQHTSAGGQTLSFSEDDLRSAVSAYDPSVHEAPIVVGHPKDDAPAYGWVKGLDYSSADGAIHAEPGQVDAEFSEMVQAGRFKKRSASFYTPDSPSNPVPGTYYLRHVGFLGAQPPAVKGLKEVAFHEDDGAIEFLEAYTTAGLFRRLRDWMLDRFGQDEANEVIPSYLVEDLEDEGRRELEPTTEPGTFQEPAMTTSSTTSTTSTGSTTGTSGQGDNGATDYNERLADIEAREQRIAEAEQKMQRDAAVAEFREHADAGRIRPQDVEGLADFAATLEADEVVDFGEGEKSTPRKFLSDFIARLPKSIDYTERAPEETGVPSGDNQAVADQAVEYQDSVRQRTGRTISFTEAVSAVRAGKHTANK